MGRRSRGAAARGSCHGLRGSGRAALLIAAVLGACARPQGSGESLHPSPAPAPTRAPTTASPETPTAEGDAVSDAAPEGRDSEDFSSPNRDFDGDGIPDRDDACPTEPEVYDGGRDDDGCPGAA
ncbi:MAG: hypothetical protein KC486_15660 [Myxococcales bacterium]|nr:hypothetical protein [Myxococcales bacterium]